ncbi:metallophosphoesterase [Bosea sp. 124]|uniref:metallophosphoesterase n=1 Tax=Bosea sp. 124 TaxID=2135642 RepID=UPI000D3A2B60|nr:metallophosphoesterase [Bosea sp. 124]PTM41622.1 calcineurin-like phosphoesterase family protein [Bosea sp. 124]
MTRPARFQILSDLHLDPARSSTLLALRSDIDAVIIAGDTVDGPALAFPALRALLLAPLPIVAVLGNREFWDGVHAERLAQARASARDHGVTLLQNEVTVLAGVRILGTTLWTDYALHGARLRFAAMEAAGTAVHDHRRITWTGEPRLLFRPEEAALLSAAARRFLADALAARFAGPTIVITHYAPHPACCDPRFAGALLDAADASDLSDLIAEGRPELCVHGHVHRSVDLRIGSTRILANPRGQRGENPGFDPGLVVEVGATGPPGA